jgi:hypothetical protein
MKLYIFKIPIICGKSAWHESCYYSRFQIPYSINGIFIEPYIIIDQDLSGPVRFDLQDFRPLYFHCYGKIDIDRSKIVPMEGPPYSQEIRYQFGTLGKVICYEKEIIKEMKKLGLL